MIRKDRERARPQLDGNSRGCWVSQPTDLSYQNIRYSSSRRQHAIELLDGAARVLCSSARQQDEREVL